VKQQVGNFNFQLKVYIKSRIRAGYNYCNLSGIIFPHRIKFSETFKDIELPSINFYGSVFEQYVDCVQFHFPGDMSFGDVVFHQNAHFHQALFSDRVHFIGSTFKDYASFTDALFEKGVVFQSHFESNFSCVGIKSTVELDMFASKCEGFAAFDNAKTESLKLINCEFNSHASFRGTCSGSTTIERTSFKKNADFTGFRSYEGSIFNDTLFAGGAYFHSALLAENTSFKHTRFKDYLSFDRTKFYGNVTFKGAYFAEACLFGRSQFTHPTSFEGCSSKEIIRMDRVDMTNVHLFNSPIESFNFICCKWPNSNDHQHVSDHPYLKPRELEDIYRRLKKSAKQNNDELVASQWHWQEKEMCLNVLKGEATPSVRDRFLKMMLEIYRQISGYGEEPLQALGFLFLFTIAPLFLFGGLKLFETGIHFTSIDWKEVVNVTSCWFQCMPLAKVSASSINLTNGQKWICWLSQIVITLQAALFAFSLRNKLRR